ncbi:MAG: hypothetical protein ACLQDY_23325 [Streptosporangiaceae bacterium]
MAAPQHGCTEMEVGTLGDALSSDLAEFAARIAEMTILDVAAAVTQLDEWLRSACPDDDRVAVDADAAVRLAGACGRLPLTLRIVAALLQAHPGLSAMNLADELGAVRQRLLCVRDEDVAGPEASDVVAVFELAYRGLPEPAAWVFRLLSVHPGPAAVETLAERPADTVRCALATLAEAQLVEASPESTGRWRMHDLVRLYARHLSDAHAQADRREQALDRLLGYYLSMIEAANDLLRERPPLPGPAPFPSVDEALAWLDAERPNLIAVAGLAARTGRDQVAASFPLCLAQYLARRKRYDDLLTTTIVGLSSARRQK